MKKDCIEERDDYVIQENKDGSKITVRELQLEILDIMDEIHRVCVKNNIEYGLIAGSALGTVNYKGFIPWDDDIDVALFRKDYEKLLEVAPKEFPKDMFFQTPYTDSLFRGHAQLRKENTTAILKNDIKYFYLCFKKFN